MVSSGYSVLKQGQNVRFLRLKHPVIQRYKQQKQTVMCCISNTFRMFAYKVTQKK